MPMAALIPPTITSDGHNRLGRFLRFSPVTAMIWLSAFMSAPQGRGDIETPHAPGRQSGAGKSHQSRKSKGNCEHAERKGGRRHVHFLQRAEAGNLGGENRGDSKS